ncbi:hypothetical protein VIBNISOn1_800066 [Vibrio nigripulchritudo SOn1]|uniref:Transposase n=1 Tax=Vibrio nigripulchritudo SOn1 TaxID=1238450 RepID=A0AAV2VY41_9VIBR|nr:hypothetical protein VIBNISOn1_800066 [Vibrio nigripulchritudo SOn1]
MGIEKEEGSHDYRKNKARTWLYGAFVGDPKWKTGTAEKRKAH